MAKKGKTKRPTVRSKRKPENPREALAWLHTIADHIQESLEEYLAHKPSRGWRVQWLANTRRLRWFADAVENYDPEKKSLGQRLGLERGPGNPGGRRKSGKSFDLARKISEQREIKSETRKTRQGKPARRTWKEISLGLEVSGDVHISDQAARQRHRRALLNRAEDDAKEFAKEVATRLKQHLEQKPPPIGEAKARNEALVEKIRAHNRRKRRSKGRHQSQGRPVVR